MVKNSSSWIACLFVAGCGGADFGSQGDVDSSSSEVGSGAMSSSVGNGSGGGGGQSTASAGGSGVTTASVGSSSGSGGSSTSSGAGGSSTGSGGSQGAPEVLTSLGDEYTPLSIAVDDGHLYWTGGSYSLAAGSGAFVMAKTGGPFSNIDTNFGGAGEIVATADHVYWSTGGPIIRWSKAGPASKLTDGYFSGSIAVYGSVLVAVHNFQPNNTITVNTFDAVLGTHISYLGDVGASYKHVTIDHDGYAYWTSTYGIQRNKYQTSVAPQTVVYVEKSTAIAVDEAYIYWADVTPESNVGRTLKAGGASQQVLASSQASPTAIAIDDVNIYWLKGFGSQLGWEVDRCPKTGGPLQVIASGSGTAGKSMTMDTDHVYWTVSGTGPIGGGGQIWRAAK